MRRIGRRPDYANKMVRRLSAGLEEQEMSQENVEKVKASMDAYNRGDFPAALAYFDPNIEWRVPPDMDLDVGVLRGHDGVLAFWQTVAETFGDFRLEPVELTDAGDRVVACLRIVGEGKRSGAPAELELHEVTEFRHGLILRLQYFRSRDAALAAARVQE
jgi:ketosteroid isomerase-like protein